MRRDLHNNRAINFSLFNRLAFYKPVISSGDLPIHNADSWSI